MTEYIPPFMLDKLCNHPIAQAAPCPKPVEAGASTTVFLATQEADALKPYGGDAFYLCSPDIVEWPRTRLGEQYTSAFYDLTVGWVTQAGERTVDKLGAEGHPVAFPR